MFDAIGIGACIIDKDSLLMLTSNIANYMDFTDILKNVRDGIIVTDLEGKALYWNQAATDMFGRSQEEMTDSNFHTINPDFNGRDMLRHFNAGHTFYDNPEWHYTRPDGSDIWVDTRLTPLYDSPKSIIGFIAVSKDITNRIGNEHALKEQRSLLVSLVESQTSYLIRIDQEGHFTYANLAFLKKHGILKGITGQTYFDYIHPDDKKKCQQMAVFCMQNPGKIKKLEIRKPNEDGGCFWIDWEFIAIIDNQGKVSVLQGVGHDITEKKESEIRLRESEASLNMAQRIAKLGSWEFYLKTREIRCSQGLYQIIELDRREQPESTVDFLSYIHEDDLKKVRRLIRSQLVEKKDLSFEFKLISATGKLKHISATSKLLQDDKGIGTKMIGTIQDVSKERHLERLLDNTNRMAKTGGWELDLIRNTLTWTKQIYRIHEVPSDFVPTIEKAFDFYHPNSQAAITRAVNELIEHGTPYDLELKLITAKKRQIWIRTTGERDVVNGKVVSIKGSSQDITERKTAEQEINNYAERLRLATQTAGIGIWDWDIKKDQFIWDEQMFRLYSIQKENFTAGYKEWSSVLHPDDVEHQESLLKEALDKKKHYDVEFRIIVPSGKVRWIKAYAKTFYDEQQNPLRMIGVNWDITQLKESEENMRRNNEELIKINSELDHFVYSTSHNLRAPLTSILGIINLIKGHDIPEEHASYLHLIEKSVIKLDETIREITDYSKNTRLDIRQEAIDFQNIIQSTIESLSFMENAGNIEFILDIPRNSHFISDDSRLRMIFNNLLSNAIKYYNPYQEQSLVDISIQETKQEVTVRIRDNGTGIATNHVDKIFNMFFRASTNSTGSGLGLYIVKEAIQKLKGSIAVHSSLGKGTEFIIYLPNMA